MHLAMIGPSSACKKQFVDFLPKIAHSFRGPASKLAPGREAVPYHFLDSDLHRVVLWDLPEMSWKSSAEDYIKELGLLYIDCVFMLFSEKYLLTDVYCKLCVAMALHGIPFFVLCTQSQEGIDESQLRRLQSSFQKQSVQVRMFDPSKPHETLEQLINDFFKEVTWNRGKGANTERINAASKAVLGQTVRIQNLEKKAELNGRCGVCIGYEKEQQRYVIRLISSGVEMDVALKEPNLSVLKPKLLGSMVQLKGLQSKPELNGRYAFVDEFLRENERYRVFVPDVPGTGLALALKSENLEKVSAVHAKPVAPPSPSASSQPKAKASTPKAKFSPAARPEPAAVASSGRQLHRKQDAEDNLMSRISAAEALEVPKAEVPKVRKLQFSLAGLLSLRVWAVVGNPDEAEEVIDHLMDCGKTVFTVSSKGDGAHFSSTAELNSDPNLPKTEVLAFVDGDSGAVLAAIDDAVRIGIHGILLLEDVNFGEDVMTECRRAGIVVQTVDILSQVLPGLGMPVAPLD